MIKPSKIFLVDYFPDASYWVSHSELFREKNVIIKASAKRIEYPRHWGVLSIKTVLEGHESYFAGDQEYKLDKHSYLVLNHDEFYGSRINESQPVESLSFHFAEWFERTTLSYAHCSDEKLLDDPTLSRDITTRFTVTQHSYSPRMRELVSGIRSLLEEAEPNEAGVEEMYYELYFEILQAESGLKQLREGLQAVKTSTRDEIFRRMLMAKDFIHSHYSEPGIGLDELSQISCMNSFHFLRCFRQVFGQTPYQYIKELRLQRAFDLLMERKQTVSSVMQSCGYQDASSFIRAFKSRYHIAPSRLSA